MIIIVYIRALFAMFFGASFSSRFQPSSNHMRQWTTKKGFCVARQLVYKCTGAYVTSALAIQLRSRFSKEEWTINPILEEQETSLQRWAGDRCRKSRVPFALYDILIHVFGNHDKMNRGLLEWRVPITLEQIRRRCGRRSEKDKQRLSFRLTNSIGDYFARIKN